MKNLGIWIKGNQYFAVQDQNETAFINLTPNPIILLGMDIPGKLFGDIIIPTSGHIAYILDKVIVGLPIKREETFLIVDYSVFLLSQREDLCISIRGGFDEDKIVMVPIRPPIYL
ncbi:MAG: hypothetical protein ACOX6Q_00175 [Candidatus Dojkabacteria bacterium]|jgi:hypothetical protein